MEIRPASQFVVVGPREWRAGKALSAAADKAAEADRAFSDAIVALYPTDGQRAAFKGWTRNEFTVLLSVISRAAEAAYLAGDCERAVGHAEHLLKLADDIPRAWQLDYPPAALALTVKAECSIWLRDSLAAYRFAKQAIALETSLPNDRAEILGGLDLRGRFRAGRQLESDPREAGAMAAAMLLNPPRDAELSDVPSERELVDNLVRWTSTARPSALSDAILLRNLAANGTTVQRNAVSALIAASAEADRARRSLAANHRGAAQRLTLAGQALRKVEAAALADGVRLPDTHASIGEIKAVLRPGEGFLFLYRSQFGPVLWGLSANGDVIVAPPTISQWAIYGPTKTSGLASQTMLRMIPPALEKSRPSLGWMARGVNWYLSRRGSPPDDALLADAIKTSATEFGPSLDAIKGLARYWSVAYNEDLDGFPLAQIPVITEAEGLDMQQKASVFSPSNPPPAPRFAPNRSFGYHYAYAITPSPRALVVLRSQGRPSPPPHGVYVGIGDIPFRGSPCTELADASDASLTSSSGQRDAILNRACLAQSRDQLIAMRPSTQGTLLVDASARESALASFRGQSIKRLVFSTHGVEPDARVSGGWPALLLNPPEVIRSTDDDGILTPLEVADLSIRADLVVLSACSTGFEDHALGEEPLAGMAFGFFLGGANSVVLTRWQLRVDVGLRFNIAFAAALDRGVSRAEAMRAARRKLIESGELKPWRWGVVELVGEGGPPS